MARSIVTFEVTSRTISPEEISKAINVDPTETWCRGGFKPNTKLPQPSNGWRFCSGESKSAAVLSQITTILQILAEVPDRLKLLESEVQSRLAIVYYSDQKSYEITLSAKLLEQLSEFRCILDFDGYFLCGGVPSRSSDQIISSLVVSAAFASKDSGCPVPAPSVVRASDPLALDEILLRLRDEVLQFQRDCIMEPGDPVGGLVIEISRNVVENGCFLAPSLVKLISEFRMDVKFRFACVI
jgi:hypothetical protein